MNCVGGLAGRGQHATLHCRSPRLPEQDTFFFSHGDSFISLRVCRCIISDRKGGLISAANAKIKDGA